MKNALYAIAGTALVGMNSANAAAGGSLFGGDKVSAEVTGAQGTADGAIQTIVGNVMVFLGILAVLYLLWGGFNILTAGGDEEKVKKGRTVIIQAIIGLVVIFLANSIVQWLLDFVLK